MGESTLLDRELVFVTGKGGVGRTTVAAALALSAAAAGRRVVLCELSGQARAARAFGLDPLRAGRELRLEGGLWTTTIDPVLALEEWAGRQIGSRRLVGLLTRSDAFSAFVHAAPGARELLALAKAWELGRSERWVRGSGRYELVVVDGPASGHGLGMLATPRTFADIARVGPVATQARAIGALLRDPGRSAVVAVARAAELPVTETIDLQAGIATTLDRPLDAIVVNALLPRRFEAADVDRLAAADGDLPVGALAAVRRQHGQATVQRGQLARLRRHANAPITTLPHLPVARLGLPELRKLAQRL